MDKLLNCSRCLFLRSANHLRFQSSRLFHLTDTVPKQTYYEVLGVDKDATRREIKEAYVKRSKEMHPDLNPSDPETHEKFVLVNEAYNVLNRTKSRREYDEMLEQPYRTTYTGGAYYPGPRPVDDDFFSDTFYNPMKAKGKSNHYYGIKGIKRRSNVEIAVLTLTFILLGTLGSVVSSLYAYRKRSEYLDGIYKENQRVYDEIRANARRYTTAEQLENFLLKHQQMSPAMQAAPSEAEKKQ